MSSPLSSFKFYLLAIIFTMLFIPMDVFCQDAEIGENLFKSNCASCHYWGPHEKKLIGPGLNEEIFEEYTTDWLYKWIRNSAELIESGDKQAVAVYEEYNKAVMTAFPQFSDQDIDNILAYIKEGPSEVIEAVSEVSSVENSESDSDSLYYIIFCIILFNIVL